MSMSSGNSNINHVLAALRPTGHPQAPRSLGITPGRPFDALLQEALSLNGQQTDGPQAKASLSKEEIENLLRRLQMQMTARLWLAVVDDGEETVSQRSFPMESPGVPAVDMQPKAPDKDEKPSKPRQTVQKSVVDLSRKDLDPIIEEAARTYDVDADLIRSVIKTESNFRNSSVSPKGAMGLMQLMPDTARELGVKDAYDPRENIMGGTRYLKGLLKRYRGDVNLSLAAYNWGMGNVEKHPDKMPQETRNYISRITQLYRAAKA